MTTLAAYIAETQGLPCVIRGDAVEIDGTPVTGDALAALLAGFAEWVPAVPSDAMVSRVWLQRALRRIEIGEGSAKDALDAALEQQTAELIEDWHAATEIARGEALIEQLRIAWQWTDAQVDALWRAADAMMRARDAAAADDALAAAGFTLI